MLGSEIMFVVDGKELLELLNVDSLNLVFIILDFNMFKMDGWEVLWEIKNFK